VTSTPISATISVRAIVGGETYEATYDGVKEISLYRIEDIHDRQETKTHLTGTTVEPGEITGWGGLTIMMDDLIDYHLSPGLKDLREGTP